MLDQIDSSYDEIIICGDFNLPNIRWNYDNEISGLMVPTSVQGNLEEEFVENSAFIGLSQILEQPDDRNHLDLAFVLNLEKYHCTWPVADDLFDHPSRFHLPFLVNCQVSFEEQVLVRNTGRINLKRTKKALSSISFEQISEEDIFEELWSDNYRATAKIHRNIEKFEHITTSLYTPLVKSRDTWLDKQPWLRGDRVYESS